MVGWGGVGAVKDLSDRNRPWQQDKIYHTWCACVVSGGGGGAGGLSKTCTTETVPGSKTKPTIHGVCLCGWWLGVAGQRLVWQKQSLVARQDLPYRVGVGGVAVVCQRLGQQKQSLTTWQGLPYMVCVWGGGWGGGCGGGRRFVKDLHNRNGPWQQDEIYHTLCGWGVGWGCQRPVWQKWAWTARRDLPYIVCVCVCGGGGGGGGSRRFVKDLCNRNSPWQQEETYHTWQGAGGPWGRRFHWSPPRPLPQNIRLPGTPYRCWVAWGCSAGTWRSLQNDRLLFTAGS